MLYSGFTTLYRSVLRRQTGLAARITRTLYGFKLRNDWIGVQADQCNVWRNSAGSFALAGDGIENS